MNRISSYDEFIDNLQKNNMISFKDLQSQLFTLNQLETLINQYHVLYGPSGMKIDASSPVPILQKIIHSLFRNEQRPEFDALLQSGIEPSSVLLRWTNNNGGGLVVNTPETRARGIFLSAYYSPSAAKIATGAAATNATTGHFTSPSAAELSAAATYLASSKIPLTNTHVPTHMAVDPRLAAMSSPFKRILPNVDNFIFDLDLTLTIQHTGGRYNGTDVYSIIDVPSIKTMLENLHDKNVFLCSRGQYNSCYTLLQNAGLLGYFCGIYAAKHDDGSDDTLLAQDPTSSLRLEYDFIGDDENKWAELKSKFVSAIRDHFYNHFHLDNLSSIYFFDDTKVNVDVVHRDNRDNNIVNAFYIESKNYKQTINIVNHILIPDETRNTQGSVSKAIAYFSSNPYKIMRIYSARVGKWYYNPNPEKPTDFLEMPIQFKPSRYLSSAPLKGGKRKTLRKKTKSRKMKSRNMKKTKRRTKLTNKKRNKKYKLSKKHKK
jgi:hypothetical protein